MVNAKEELPDLQEVSVTVTAQCTHIALFNSVKSSLFKPLCEELRLGILRVPLDLQALRVLPWAPELSNVHQVVLSC